MNEAKKLCESIHILSVVTVFGQQTQDSLPRQIVILFAVNGILYRF